MSGFVDAEQGAILDERIDGKHYFLGLHVDAEQDPGQAALPNPATGADFVEPTDAAYARFEIDDDDEGTPAGLWAAATVADPSEKTNAVEFLWPAESGEDWGYVHRAGLFTAATGGTPVAIGTPSQVRQILEGDKPRFGPGTVKFTLTRPSS